MVWERVSGLVLGGDVLCCAFCFLQTSSDKGIDGQSVRITPLWGYSGLLRGSVILLNLCTYTLICVYVCVFRGEALASPLKTAFILVYDSCFVVMCLTYAGK